MNGVQRKAFIGAAYSAECFGPVATGREKRRELEEKKEKASAKGF